MSEPLLSCFYRAWLGPRQFLWDDYTLEVFVASSLDALEKSIYKILPSNFTYKILLWTPNIRRIVRIFDVVDRFLWKPIWFFLKTFSISGSMRLSGRRTPHKLPGTQTTQMTALLSNTPTQAQALPYSLEHEVDGISLHMNAD